ncbi:O-antigen ligase family protein [Acinetobacter baumannii]|uniref:O-antigen ligase family protein n=1 Tax=Acinetobacter baumannii TaxID=470 RepID=UPI00040218A8|nr:O-antigen ligase family protein [Acinetobacter baumannii]EIB7036708.1 O-antigen ligase family protein [Acinetobacter baumannii]ELB2471532.1 O-antigen ligase family protein [Acinetobacter baumannii]MCE6705519.1 O-antigen ligase family protein [Acinetobacter baumannii]MCM1639387.1 O-antigen ligase family protein [Acinetobacter baumannii]MCV2392042.1 O-antigen ligase family protein [Acinetobacter baumannii]
MKNFVLGAVFFYLTTSFLSVSIEPSFMYLNYLFAGVLFLISIPYFLKNNFVNYQFLRLLSLYYLAALFSIFFGFVALYVLEFEKIAFFDIELYGRIFNVILFSILSLSIVSLCDYKNYLTVRLVLLCYCVGCALLILTGYWQALSLYLGIGTFPFETRNWVHGFNKTDYDIEARLTGIAAEPSYFVPFVLDFIILSLIVFKSRSLKIIAFTFGIFAMMLSFSPSGYASTFLAFFLAMLFFVRPNSRTIKYLVAFIITMPFLLLLLISKVKNLGYVFDRLSNLSADGRFKSIYETLMQFFDSNIINLLFGYGVTNFKVATQYTDYSALMTSNNLFADVLVEMGVVGFALIVILLSSLFFSIYKSSINNFQKFLTYALFFDLLSTSMIRADYSTSRFFIIIAIIFLLSKYDIYKKRVVK